MEVVRNGFGTRKEAGWQGLGMWKNRAWGEQGWGFVEQVGVSKKWG
jgi:hypothetical protein